ncbi:MAG: YihY/virulence factor BrkB family protein [Desulfurivibrio sp.]|nr:YihY/virulence factor BrkB family protein [Desulfurivibrio sp.]
MNQESTAGKQALGCRLRQQGTRLRQWLWQPPTPNEPAWRKTMRELLQVLQIFAREFDRDRIPLRASALTFTIMLSLVPTLALGTAVLKGLGADDQMRQAAHRFVSQMEDTGSLPSDQPPREQLPTLPESADPGEAGDDLPAPATPADFTGHLHQAVEQIFEYVDRTDFAALGAFGIIGMVVAVVAVLGSIERAMNAIWHTSLNRPLGRRLMDYLALMILLPLTVNLTLATEATLKSEGLRDRFQVLLPISGAQELLLSLMPLLLLTLTFTLLYRFLPNTRVQLTPALIGGFCGALAWLVFQAIYLNLQIGVARYNAIYGSFATLPLFLIWLQICWIVFLAGAEMSFAVQARHHYRLDDDEISPVNRLTMAFALLAGVQRDFQARRLSEPNALAEELRQPLSVVNQVATTLEQAGLLRQAVVEEQNGYLPGTELARVSPAEVLDLIVGRDIPSLTGATLVDQAMTAARQTLGNQSLPSCQQPTGGH